jgi:hypothetical protein
VELELFNKGENKMPKTHPECREDEVFIGNFNEMGYLDISWQTKRQGIAAYGFDGKPMGPGWAGTLFPVFVEKDEIRKKNPEVLRGLESRQEKDSQPPCPNPNCDCHQSSDSVGEWWLSTPNARLFYCDQCKEIFGADG